MAILIAFAMCVLSFVYHPVEIEPVPYGICLPTPDSWNVDPLWAWIINTFLIALNGLLIYLINKSYNFVRTTEPTIVALFLIMSCSCPWFTEGINTSVILCLANIVALGIIFASFDTGNATQQMFILGVVVGIGSMFQYAFLPMIMVYILWALFMKILRFKETLAILIGLVCPYWIAVGVGWIRMSDFAFPSITPLFGLARDHSELILLLIGIAVAALIGFFVVFINSMKLYAGNSKVNSMNLCVSTLGAASVIFILVDFDNMPAYVETLYMACAVQVGNICALWNPKMPWLVTVIPASLYIGLFACSMFL